MYFLAVEIDGCSGIGAAGVIWKRELYQSIFEENWSLNGKVGIKLTVMLSLILLALLLNTTKCHWILLEIYSWYHNGNIQILKKPVVWKSSLPLWKLLMLLERYFHRTNRSITQQSQAPRTFFEKHHLCGDICIYQKWCVSSL